MALSQITDHQAQALARLAEQYKGSASFTALIRVATAEHQAIEDVLWAEFVETVDSAVGASLDLIGKVVGQPREGRDDVTYRLWVKARVKVNRSGGTGADIVSIFTALCPGLDVRLEERFPATFILHIEGGAAPTPTALASLLQIAKAGGVKAILEYLNAAPTASFSFAGGPGLGFGAGAFAGGAE